MISWAFMTTVTSVLSDFTSTASLFGSTSGYINGPLGGVTENTSSTSSYSANSNVTGYTAVVQANNTDVNLTGTTIDAVGNTQQGLTSLGLTASTSSSGVTITELASSGGNTTVSNTSISNAYPTIFQNTTTTSTNSLFYTTTATSIFTSTGITTDSASSYDDGMGDTYTFPPESFTETYSATYVNITGTSTSSTQTITTITETTMQSSLGMIQGLGIMPSPGEIIWYSLGTIINGPLSSLASITSGSFSYIPEKTFVTYSPSSTTSYGASTETTTIQPIDSTTEVNAPTTIYQSNFEGGISSNAVTTFSAVTTTTSFGALFTPSTILSTTTGSFWTASLTGLNTITDIVTTSSGYFSALALNNGSVEGFFSTWNPTHSQNINVTATSTTLETVHFPSSHSGSSSSSTVATFTVTISDYSTSYFSSSQARTGITSNFSFFNGTYMTVISNSPQLLIKYPNGGFRITPTDALVNQIGIGDTSTFSMAADEGSAIFGIQQTVPMSYQFGKTWRDSLGNLFSASWSSISATVTGSYSGLSFTGTSTLTTYTTSSSALVWTAGASVGQTLFQSKISGTLGVGSGSYGTDFVVPNTFMLSSGCYWIGTASTEIDTSYILSTVTGSEVIRSMAMVISTLGGQPYTVELVSRYNQ